MLTKFCGVLGDGSALELATEDAMFHARAHFAALVVTIIIVIIIVNSAHVHEIKFREMPGNARFVKRQTDRGDSCSPKQKAQSEYCWTLASWALLTRRGGWSASSAPSHCQPPMPAAPTAATVGSPAVSYHCQLSLVGGRVLSLLMWAPSYAQTLMAAFSIRHCVVC